MEEHTITSDEASGKSFILAEVPTDTDQVSLTILGGVAQNNGTDYAIADSTVVSWNGLGLDGFIEENDIAQCEYPYQV